jgi:hypothetical protein
MENHKPWQTPTSFLYGPAEIPYNPWSSLKQVWEYGADSSHEVLIQLSLDLSCLLRYFFTATKTNTLPLSKY